MLSWYLGIELNPCSWFQPQRGVQEPSKSADPRSISSIAVDISHRIPYSLHAFIATEIRVLMMV